MALWTTPARTAGRGGTDKAGGILYRRDIFTG